MRARKLNLILIPQKHKTGFDDFIKIAGIIRRKCRDVVPYIARQRRLKYSQFLFSMRPCLYVAMYEAAHFEPVRGRCMRGNGIDKAQQYLRLEQHGITTLKWESILPGARYAPEDWGAYVIVKPHAGSSGHDVKIRKTTRVHYEKDCAIKPHLIQKFVHTGPQPVSYRALTFFGQVLYLQKSTNTACGNLLTNPTLLRGIGGHNPVATSALGTAALVVDEEIMAYAQHIALTAFPEIPVLGQDIVRDLETGALYCLEVNPYGSTWHFSSKQGISVQESYQFSYEKQFDAFNLVADILIQKTRELAQ